MEVQNNRGSEWRRWDLHIHTPCTKKNDQYVGNNSEEKWENFYESIRNYVGDGSDISKAVAVIGITDYLSIDNYKKVIENRDKLPKCIKLILPNIEARMLPIAKEPINVHFIFNPDFVDKLDEKFFCKLKKIVGSKEYIATRDGLIRFGKETGEKGNDNSALQYAIEQFVLEPQMIDSLLKDQEFRDNVIIVVANGSKDGVSGVSSHEPIINTSEERQTDITVRHIYCFADMIFSGNPSDRIYFLGKKEGHSSEEIIGKYGSLKPCIHGSDAHTKDKIFSPDKNRFCWIKADTTFEGLKQILYEPEDRVRIQSNRPEEKPEYQIIDSIKLCHEDFGEQVIPFNSSLNVIIGGRSSGKSLLLGCIANLAGYDGSIKAEMPTYDEYVKTITAKASLMWKDKANDSDIKRVVEYFSQSYVSDYVRNPKKLDIIIEENIERSNKDFQNIKNEYIRKKMLNFEEISSEVRNCVILHEQIEKLEKQLSNFGDKRSIENEISKLSNVIKEFREAQKKEFSEVDDNQYHSLKENKKLLDGDFKKCEITLTELNNLKNINLLKESNIFDLFITDSNLKEIICKKYSDIKSKFLAEWELFINEQLKQVNNKKIDINNEVNNILNDSSYTKGLEYYKKNEDIVNIEKRLEIEQEKLKEYNFVYDTISEYRQRLQYSSNKIFETIENNYKLLLEYQSQIEYKIDEMKIFVSVNINLEIFKNFIQGNYDNRNRDIDKYYNYDDKNLEKFIQLLKEVFDKTINKNLPLKKLRDIYNIAYKLISKDYFIIHYDVEYQNDTLNSMSEGKRASVILRVLLGLSTNKCPILLDQPEDDLDNRTIFDDLVKYIKNKKKERQIFIVTHNANIVVGADAEEIIVANQHGTKTANKDNVKFQYVSGALENTFVNEHSQFVLESKGIREHVCEILEGGTDAFELREKKYNINSK